MLRRREPRSTRLQRHHQKTSAGELLEHAKRHARGAFLRHAGVVHVEYGARVLVPRVRQENPGRDVNAGLRKEFQFLDAIAVALGGNQWAHAKGLRHGLEAQELRNPGQQFAAPGRPLGVRRRRFALGRERPLLLEDEREDCVALVRIPHRSVGRAVEVAGRLGVEFGLAVGTLAAVEPAAEPVRGGLAQFQGVGMRVGGLCGSEFLRRAELLVSRADVIRRRVEFGRKILNQRK